MMAGLRHVALAALVAPMITACSGGSSPSVTPTRVGTTASVSTLRLAGVGDSLTAGVQSGGLLGVAIANPIAGSLFGPVIPPTQGNGFWAQLWSQANNGADPLNPANSPLPLMAGALGQLLVPDAKGLATPINFPCSGITSAGFSAASAPSTRLNPSTTPFDVAVPGQTVHEALTMIAPLTPCQLPPTTSPTYLALSQLVGDESGALLPVLTTFGSGVTQVQAAVALKPAITTVWLGSNDVLKYLFSGGALAATDPVAMNADTVTIIRSLQAAGSHVAVANLIDIVRLAYFTDAPRLQAILNARFVAAGVPPANASSLAASYVAQAQRAGLTGDARLTLPGLGHVLALAAAGEPLMLSPASDLVPGALVDATQALNDRYNAQIAAAAQSTGATLVDINHTFKQIAAAGGVPISAHCCTLAYGGGLFSLDGIHPSNTAYAIVGNQFIAAIDTAFGAAIPAIDVQRVSSTDPFVPR